MDRTPALGMPRRHTISVPIPFTGAYGSIAAVCAVLAWEWTVSGLDKLVNHIFVDSFASYVSGTVKPDSPAVWRALLTGVVVPHARLFAIGSIALELTLATTFAAAAVALVLRTRHLVRPALFAVLGAGAVSTGFAANLAILNNDAPPWKLTGAPFGSGVPVEYLLLLISVAGVVGAGILLRRTRYLARRPGSAR